MDQKLRTIFNTLQIEFSVVTHEPLASAYIADIADVSFKGPVPKNLLLKNKGKFFLACLIGNKRLDFRELKQTLNLSGDLKFASDEELMEQFQVTAGSVSIFSSIYAKPDLTIVFDEDLWTSPWVSFHPNVNTSTVEMNHENFAVFWEWLSLKKLILKL